MAFTEFYCDATNGSDMNGGAPITAGYPFTYTSGNWDGTSTFIAAGAISATIAAGDFASVYNNNATTPVYLARVASVNTGTNTIVLDTTAKVGSAPTSNANARSITIGGPFKGPNGTVNWPVGTISNVMTNTTGNPPRINFKNNATYSISAVVSTALPGIMYQGYATTPGDLGRATIDASTNAIVIWSFTNAATNSRLYDMIFAVSATTGTSVGVSIQQQQGGATRCVVHGARGNGWNITNVYNLMEECEAYDCNKSNSANQGGFGSSSSWVGIRCISHDNSSGANAHGIVNTGTSLGAATILINCIMESNAGTGHLSSSSGAVYMLNCDIYSNGSGGVKVDGTPSVATTIQNCNILKNTGDGVAGSSTGTGSVFVVNCGFGLGTQVNTGSNTSGRSVQEINSVTYALNTTPWVDPANGDFRINLAAAIGTGRGAFTQTQASYTGASSSPVIGACQLADYPVVSNVKSGITYGNVAYTGTLSTAKAYVF